MYVQISKDRIDALLNFYIRAWEALYGVEILAILANQLLVEASSCEQIL